MSAYSEVFEMLETICAAKQIKHVAWVAAGGSMGGFYPAQYFMDKNARTISSQLYTSNEFVHLTPAYLGMESLVVLCSMRGTPETIEAARVAKEQGATTIALYVDHSELVELADYSLVYESIAVDASRTEMVNSSRGLMIAEALLQLSEGFAEHESFVSTWDSIDGIYRKAFEAQQTLAASWAEKNKDASYIHVIGSGPAFGSAYIFAICNIEEMLQIESPCTNSCEWFHGPFEILNKKSSLFLLKSAGRSRVLDERVERFIERYGKEQSFILDAFDLGLGEIDEPVREYFNHILYSPILNNVYMRALAAVRGKDYLDRTYMWKVEY